ncbi:hypothetical protein FHS25_000635 [Rhizobium laguerreae]|uniref:Uncharacterized protein n=1 Tax=Rhizobium laguerreae TaxID=1076926 RepID=A0ABR6G3N9_9HYPH|nr:hypothetical protein [Rhizobium laguerreae]
MRRLLATLAHQVDPGAGKENRDFQPGGDAAIGDGEGDGGQFGFDALGDEHDQFVGCRLHSILLQLV